MALVLRKSGREECLETSPVFNRQRSHAEAGAIAPVPEGP